MKTFLLVVVLLVYDTISSIAEHRVPKEDRQILINEETDEVEPSERFQRGSAAYYTIITVSLTLAGNTI